LTLGIGDNRKECYFLPVSFNLFRRYIDQGFELEELIIKKQRHCQGSILGAYLSYQYDFLLIQHEFIAIFKKSKHPSTPFMKTINLIPYTGKLFKFDQSKIQNEDIELEFNSIWSTKDHSFTHLLNRIARNFGVENSEYITLAPDDDILDLVNLINLDE
jgi:hypothetical protein